MAFSFLQVEPEAAQTKHSRQSDAETGEAAEEETSALGNTKKLEKLNKRVLGRPSLLGWRPSLPGWRPSLLPIATRVEASAAAHRD